MNLREMNKAVIGFRGCCSKDGGVRELYIQVGLRLDLITKQACVVQAQNRRRNDSRRSPRAES